MQAVGLVNDHAPKCFRARSLDRSQHCRMRRSQP
jgi:hypothetical protein